MHWDYILILAVLAVLIPWRGAARIRELLRGPEFAPSTRMRIYLSTIALQWILVAAILWRTRAHGMPLSALGISLPNPARAALAALILSVALVINQVFAIRRLAGMPPERRGTIAQLAEKLLPRTRGEMCAAIFLVGTVAICEEIIYRGFVQTVFQDLPGGTVFIAAAISAAFFASAHLYQGRKGVIVTFVVGVFFSGARIFAGSLVPSVITHFAVDFSAGIAARRLIDSSSGQTARSTAEAEERF
jgi:CAAX protease family protein